MKDKGKGNINIDAVDAVNAQGMAIRKGGERSLWALPNLYL